MRKYLTALLCLLCMVCMLPAQAETADPWPEVRHELALLGIELDDAAYDRAIQSYQEQLRWFAEFGFAEQYATKEHFAYVLLLDQGIGHFDEETWAFTPASDQVYALDAEVFNVGVMYTDFLKGVQAIVDDAVFDNVKEDLSGVDWEWNGFSMTDGHRDVAFTCNGHPYAKRLDSYGDWLNPEIIDFVNEALRKEGCRGQLYAVSDSFDQMLILIYGDEARAAALCGILGTEPWVEESGQDSFSLLDLLY